MIVKKNRQFIYDLVNKFIPFMRNKEWFCIYYGSNLDNWDEKISDIDICIFAKNISLEERKELSTIVKNFHIKNNLYIDLDIPYINKIVFQYEDVLSIIKNPPFPVVSNTLKLVPIEKNREFLDSEVMRKRLFINIMTVKSTFLYGNKGLYKQLQNKMYEILFDILVSSLTTEHSLNEIIDKLYFYNNKKLYYKNYLGYNYYNREEKKFIYENIKNIYYNRYERNN